jgi:hypothetical protein
VPPHIHFFFHINFVLIFGFLMTSQNWNSIPVFCEQTAAAVFVFLLYFHDKLEGSPSTTLCHSTGKSTLSSTFIFGVLLVTQFVV